MAFWNTYANCTETGTNGATKTSAADGWDAGARSLTSITGPCTVSFTAPGGSPTHRMCGLGIGTLDPNYTARGWSIYATNLGDVKIYEGVTSRGIFGTYTAGDVFKVVYDGKILTYYKNDVFLYKSTVPPSAGTPLYAETSLYHGTVSGAASVDNVTFAEGVNVPFQWLDVVGATTGANGYIKKTAGNSWNNSGACSNYGFPKTENCYLEVTGDIAQVRGVLAGLYWDYSTDASWNYIPWGLYWQGGGADNWNIRRTNFPIWFAYNAWGKWRDWDATTVWRIGVYGGYVKAFKDGVLVWTDKDLPIKAAATHIYARFTAYYQDGTIKTASFQKDPGPVVIPEGPDAGDDNVIPSNTTILLALEGNAAYDVDTTVGTVRVSTTSASGPWTTVWTGVSGFAAGYSGTLDSVYTPKHWLEIIPDAGFAASTQYWVNYSIFNTNGEETNETYTFTTITEALKPATITVVHRRLVGGRATYDVDTGTWTPDVTTNAPPYDSSPGVVADSSYAALHVRGAGGPGNLLLLADSNLRWLDSGGTWQNQAITVAGTERHYVGSSHAKRYAYFAFDQALPPTLVKFDLDTETVSYITCGEAGAIRKYTDDLTDVAGTSMGSKYVSENGLMVVGPYVSGTWNPLSSGIYMMYLSNDGGTTWREVSLPTGDRVGATYGFQGSYAYVAPHARYWIDNDRLLCVVSNYGDPDPSTNPFSFPQIYQYTWSTDTWVEKRFPGFYGRQNTGSPYSTYNYGGDPGHSLFQGYDGLVGYWMWYPHITEGNRIWWHGWSPVTSANAAIVVTDYSGKMIAWTRGAAMCPNNSHNAGVDAVSYVTPTDLWWVSNRNTTVNDPSRHLIRYSLDAPGNGGISAEAIDIGGSTFDTTDGLVVGGSYEFATPGFSGEDSIGFSVEVSGIWAEDPLSFNVNITGIKRDSELGFSTNVESTSVIKRPIPIQERDNPFTHLGKLVSLKRGPEEKNASYRRRVMDTYSNMANSTYTGMINGITRELGLSLYEGVEINPRTDIDGNFLAPDPFVVFDDTHLLLYSDYVNGQLDWAIDRLEKGGNYEHLGDLVDFVNTTSFFEAALRPNVSPLTRSATILNQTNRISVDFEYVKVSTRFRLKKWPVVNGSVFFSNPSVFVTRKSTAASVSVDGDYHVDHDTGVVTVAVVPGKQDSVRYQYSKYPFYATASPIVIHDINSEAFKRKMFEQIFSDDENDYVNGLPTELGIDIINELLSISPMYWGE